MCFFHWTFLVFVKYRGSGRGPRHTLNSYVYAIALIAAIVVLLFAASLVMMLMDQFYDAHIPKRGAAVPAMIGGILLIVVILEAAILQETIYKLWKEYSIERLHDSRMANDPNAPPLEYSDQDTMEAELEEASRTLANRRREASLYGEGTSGDEEL